VAPLAALSDDPVVRMVGGQRLSVCLGPDGHPVDTEQGAPLKASDGFAWMAWGDRPASPPPRLELPNRRGYRLIHHTVPAPADFRLALENSLDLIHSSFVHTLTQPSWYLRRLPGLPPVEVAYQATTDGLEVEARLWGRVIFRQRFHLPDRIWLQILPESPVTVELEVHHVPESPTSCRMEITLGHPTLRQPPPRLALADRLLKLHCQDLAVLEAQQRTLSLPGTPFTERHCAADAYTLLMRRILDLAAAGQWPPADLGERRVVHIRL
jgi:hypothetical protein